MRDGQLTPQGDLMTPRTTKELPSQLFAATRGDDGEGFLRKTSYSMSS